MLFRSVERGQETGRRKKTRRHPISTMGSTFNYPSYTEIDITFGKSVEEWLTDRRGKHNFLTGAGPSNKITREA